MLYLKYIEQAILRKRTELSILPEASEHRTIDTPLLHKGLKTEM